jgi:hypothetical protein
MKFGIWFHGPFAVSTGSAGRGADSTVNDDLPLPESSIKGVMLAAARTVGFPSHLIDEVFGAQRKQSPWSWGPVEFNGPIVRQQRARVAIDQATGTAKKHALAFVEQHWAESATFDILPMRYIDPAVVSDHEVVLAVAGASVESLGAERRRGSGWVSIRPMANTNEPLLNPAMRTRLDTLIAHRGGQ